MSKDTGGPAFPKQGLSGLPNGDVIYGREGMTLRDYFAAKAMQALIARATQDEEVWDSSGGPEDFMEAVAVRAGLYADAMLTERAK